MAMPVIKGKKSPSEKFAGALDSFCIEALMQDGKALQAGTSHDLGQNFGKAFDVKFQNVQGEMEYVWQTSWGVSTRLIGGLIMTHSDDSGLVLPPKLAPVQVAIIPILGKNADENAVKSTGEKIAKELRALGISTVFDTRDYKPGYKYFEWEQKGVPLRLDLGTRDLQANQITAKDRISPDKMQWPLDNLAARVRDHLETFQHRLFERAQTHLRDNSVQVDNYNDFKAIFAEHHSKFVYAHWDGTSETEARIKEETKATVRCIPFDTTEPGQCIITGQPSAQRVLFAKNY
jgi:prolyl-tRNA synthetase